MTPKDSPQPAPEDVQASDQRVDPSAKGLERRPLFIEVSNTQVFREITPQELGRVDAEVSTTQEGFNIGGRNESSAIRSFQSLNGVPIASLEQTMRSGRLSMAEYLGRGESLTDVMVADNDTVLGMGLTHQQLADFLSYFDEASRYAYDQTGQRPRLMQFNGRTYSHGVSSFRGQVHQSPFGGEMRSNTHGLICLDDGSSISYTGIAPVLARGYGFYGGNGTAHRVDPRNVAETAGFIPRSEHDPIIQLVRDRNASVVISNSDQITRMRNLMAVGVNLLEGPNLQLTPDNANSFIGLVNYLDEGAQHQRSEAAASPSNLDRLMAHLVPDRMIPTNYQLDPRQVRLLTEALPNYPREVQTAVINSINRIVLNPENGSPNRGFIQALVRNSLTEFEQKQYYLDLLKKVAIEPDSIVDVLRGIRAVVPQTGVSRITAEPILDESKMHEVAIVLGEALPNLRDEIVKFYSQLGRKIPEGASLERFIQDADGLENHLKANIGREEMYRKHQSQQALGDVREAVGFAQRVGKVDTASETDMVTLFDVLDKSRDPNYQYTAAELSAMARLGVDPGLVPYALKIRDSQPTYFPNPSDITAQLYNGVAARARAEESNRQ